MTGQRSYGELLDRGLRIFFAQFVAVTLSRPARALFFLLTIGRQVIAARTRRRLASAGLRVPPIVIFSITDRCNLSCRGCYAKRIRGRSADALGGGELRRIVGEAEELGVSFFVIAGGEPLLRPEILSIVRKFPRVMFLLVTNGVLLDASLIRQLAAQPNTIPVLSIEGNEEQTDGRRGRGVYRRLALRMTELARARVLFSLSITVNRANFATVTGQGFIQAAIEAGCRFFLFLEYTPLQVGDDEWDLTEAQREEMRGLIAGFRARYRAVFIAVPWDEEGVGGCLAAGRGFVHVSAEGRVEPCPFAPYSDASLKELSLRQALASPFLAALRRDHERFEDTTVGCTLWKERERVNELLTASRREAPNPGGYSPD